VNRIDSIVLSLLNKYLCTTMFIALICEVKSNASFDLCDGLMDECINFVPLLLIWTSSSRTWWSWSSSLELKNGCRKRMRMRTGGHKGFFLFLEDPFSLSW
jgi:hypothetical protein